MSKINVQLIGTAQWYYENDGPKKKENPLLDALNPSIFVQLTVNLVYIFHWNGRLSIMKDFSKKNSKLLK